MLGFELDEKERLLGSLLRVLRAGTYIGTSSWCIEVDWRSIVKQLKKIKVAQSRADVNIGKKGIHPGLVEEVRRRLEEEGAIKIRILKNARNIVSEDDIRKLAEEVGALIVDSRGYTYVLVKKGVKRIKIDKLRQGGESRR